jgi:hypothetical protein
MGTVLKPRETKCNLFTKVILDGVKRLIERFNEKSNKVVWNWPVVSCSLVPDFPHREIFFD